ncbi:glycoside hydrolase family 88 protein [Pedobacter arcticus]|uniref:glycoside hydrolase family 88 protein n=1 Tax=Pedobacter arcticus TaxID=752140 RepID=UPI00031B0B18|nr:glycoside hydrolase family 88 protein [Pedobacter arcticus]
MKTRLTHFLKLSFFLFFASTYSITFAQSNLQPDSIIHIMKKTADWQWKDLAENGWKTPKTDWTNGALYTGMMAWGKIANDNTYYKKLIEVGNDNKWGLGPERYFADDYCVGQTYSQLYQIYKDPKYIAKFKNRADTIVTLPHTESLLWVNEIYNREWAWCDALFMGPPALGYLTQATGDSKYLDTASKLWWKSSDYLYDNAEHLFYRDSRYFDKKENNGAKVFWGRGNGWVMGGLVRILEVMPQNHPARKKFEKQFKEMSKRIASLQQPDGSWHASLLDPASFPAKETSGTGFFAYALAWGINNGLLNYNDYKEVVKNAWTALVTSVHPNGKLGYVQAQGRDPQGVTYDDTDVYGVGAFLLAGSEIYKMELNLAGGLLVNVKNTMGIQRMAQTVEVSWSAITKRNKKVNADNVVVIDVISGKQIPSQLLFNGKKRPQTLIFQTDISAGTELFFTIKEGKRENYTSKVYGRQVPERFDDFAWENDKVAFRMYGAALETQSDNAKGLDVWSKNTSELLLNKWYKNGDYHTNHGQGMDGYKVGMSLGSGDSAPFIDGKFIFPKNYSSYKIIDNGPIRLTFELYFVAWNVNGQQVTQTKHISLDAGSNLNKIVSHYYFKGASLPIAAGVTKHANDGSIKIDHINNYVSYWDKTDGKVDNGMIGVGVIFPADEKFKLVDEANHLLGLKTISKNQAFTYYQGNAWSRNPSFPKEIDWIKYLEVYSKSLATPLIVTY